MRIPGESFLYVCFTDIDGAVRAREGVLARSRLAASSSVSSRLASPSHAFATSENDVRAYNATSENDVRVYNATSENDVRVYNATSENDVRVYDEHSDSEGVSALLRRRLRVEFAEAAMASEADFRDGNDDDGRGTRKLHSVAETGKLLHTYFVGCDMIYF